MTTPPRSISIARPDVLVVITAPLRPVRLAFRSTTMPRTVVPPISSVPNISPMAFTSKCTPRALALSTSTRPPDGIDRMPPKVVVNPAAAPDYLSIDFTRTTPNEYLMRAAPLRDVEHTLEAILPDRRLQELLKIGPHEPCLLLHRRTWTRDIVASRAWLTHPGSRYRMHARFTHARNAEPGIQAKRPKPQGEQP
ncbi:MAG: UTRA domain-containing protein [Proteobacteria bacterium]|nr:UTRA domain-containing protein [Pseudomonadota bacterium]